MRQCEYASGSGFFMANFELVARLDRSLVATYFDVEAGGPRRLLGCDTS